MSSAALAALLALAAAAPSRAAAAAPVIKNPDTLVVLPESDVESLDPARAYDSRSHAVILNVYEPLLGYAAGSASELVPVLSTAVPSRANGLLSADGLVYRFPIRRGVRFHDGTELTPDDVRYSLLRFMLTDRPGGPSSLLLEPLLGLASTRRDGKPLPGLYEAASAAVTVDGGDVVLKLPRPFAPLPSILASFGAVTSRRWMAAHGQWDGAPQTWESFNGPESGAAPLSGADGTGPFQLVRWDRRAAQIVVERNERYWRSPAALKRVVWKTVPEFPTRRLMLANGDADSITVPRQYAPQLAGLPGVRVTDGYEPIQGPVALMFTFKADAAANPYIGSGKLDGDGIPPDFFSDVEARRAFAYAFDYDAYIRDVQRGSARGAAGFIPRALLGHRDGPPRSRHDPAAAAEHLKKAWGGEAWRRGFRLTMTYRQGNEDRLALCQIMKRGVESLGSRFHVDIMGLPGSTTVAHRKKTVLYVNGWYADYPDPHNLAFALMHSAGPHPSLQGYANPEADALIERAAVETDPVLRAGLYERIQSIADDDLPQISVAFLQSLRVERDWVRGFVFRPVFPGAPAETLYYDVSKGEPRR